ncbi:MAG: TonB-dependent receptor [Blastocatellia bacterium]|nr:TonB-dependent receptor [Blastocatellia bacterium]
MVGGTITSKEIEEIPVNTRNPLDLVLTLGGTSEEALSTRDLAEDRNQSPATAPAEQGNFSLSGGASYSNNITIDGLDNNDDRGAGVRFQPSLESIDEVQVVTNQFSAEYGRASGGRINFRTRSGSNKFRGRVFMFFRDDNLNANTWYNNTRGFARLPLTEYNPGFTFSGPIFKNRTFFSIAYEYTNLKDTTFIDTFVPVGVNSRYTLPTSNASCPPTAITGCFDNSSATPTAIAPYNVLFDTPSVNHSFTAKIDHRLTSNNDFTFGWQLGRRNNRRTVGTSTTRLDDALQARNQDTDAYNFTDNHVFGANAVNQFRMQYSVYEPSFQTENPFDPVVLIGYRNPITASGQTLIAGNSTASIFSDATGFPQNRQETRWQFQDSLTYVVGNQTLKGGFDLQTVRSKAIGLGDATGTFNFLNILTYQQNVLSRYRQNFGTASDVKNTYWGVFFNDEIRLRSNLTLSAGLRYEKETAVDDDNNFGPRLGIAYSPWKDGKGVIRFGAGIFYNRVLLRTVADSIQNNVGIVPFDTNFIGTATTDTRRTAILAAIATFPDTYPSQADLQSLVATVCTPLNTVALPCNSGTGFQLNQGSTGNPLRSVDPNLEIPHSSQFNIGFEREIGKSFVFEANYTWNRTDNLWRDRNINAPVLPTGFSTWTDYLLANPFTFTNANGTIRTYRFHLGADRGVTTSTTATGSTSCPTTGSSSLFTANSTCFVNLNSVSSSSTLPSTAVTGLVGNNTGGPIGIALASIARFRPDPNFEEKSRIGSIGRAMYEGLILEVRRRFRPLGWGFGASFRGVYTLSLTEDDGLNNTSNAEINGDFNSEYARSLQDRRHRFALTGTFETPSWLGKLRFSPLFRYGSSAPFSLGAGGTDRNLDDLSNDRLNFSGNVRDIVWREPGSPFPAALASQFSLQPIGAKSGNLARNAGTGPSFYLFDLSLSRDFKLNERMRLKPTFQFDNIFNAAVFNYGAGFIDFDALSPNASATTIANFQNAFLVPTRTFRPRQIRIGLRFDF